MKYLVAVFILLIAWPVQAKVIDVLLYVNKATVGELSEEELENAPSTVKKKGDFPALKNVLLENEIITHYKKLAEQGGKAFWHCLVERSDDNTKQFTKIKIWIDGQNEGKPINQQILYWSGKGATAVWTNFVKARSDDPFIMTLVKKIVKYRVETTCDGQPCTRTVTIEEAEAPPYNETIQWGKAVIPHKFYGRE
jgi:hypothetical protein